MTRPLLLSLSLAALAGCSSLLPKTTETSGDTKTAWQSYQQAEQSFARITPRVTTVAELRAQHLDPRQNANMRIVPRYEIVQLFMVNGTMTSADLDDGVRECLEAQAACTAWEITQQAAQKRRSGNAALDMLRVRRETENSGWRFSGRLLLKDGVVIYKLTGGQPRTLDYAHTEDMLGPLQLIGSKLNALNGINVTDVRNGIKPASSPTHNGTIGDPVTALGLRR